MRAAKNEKIPPWHMTNRHTEVPVQRIGECLARPFKIKPLHAGFVEDRGGNSVDVQFNGRKENLHSLWDTALLN
jgi:hypothetical protein